MILPQYEILSTVVVADSMDCQIVMNLWKSYFFPSSSKKVKYPSVHKEDFNPAVFPVVWALFLSCAAEEEIIMYLVFLGRQRLLSTGPGRDRMF